MYWRPPGPETYLGAAFVPGVRTGGAGGVGIARGDFDASAAADGAGRDSGYGVEYITAVFYEKVLGVSFWDYRELRWNLHGRVCLSFALAWSALLPAAVYWVHPAVTGWVEAVPAPVTVAAVLAVGMDLLISALLLRRTGKRECLQWYRRESRKAFLDTSG